MYAPIVVDIVQYFMLRPMGNAHLVRYQVKWVDVIYEEKTSELITLKRKK